MGSQAPRGQCRRRGALHGRRSGCGRRGRPFRSCAPIASGCAGYAKWASCRSGTTGSTNAPSSIPWSTREPGAAPERLMDKARAKGHVSVLEKLTEQVDGEHRIIEEVPLIVRRNAYGGGNAHPCGVGRHAPRLHPIDDHRPARASLSLPHRRRCSQGRGRRQRRTACCWVVLRRVIDSDDPLFLQVKEAKRSVLAPYVDHQLSFENQGRRVVVGQRLAQGSPDIFLGWGESERQGFLRPPACRHERQREVQRERPQQHRRFRRILCPGACWAPRAGPREVWRPCDDRRVLRNNETLDEAIGKIAMALRKADRRGPRRARQGAGAPAASRSPHRSREVGVASPARRSERLGDSS